MLYKLINRFKKTHDYEYAKQIYNYEDPSKDISIREAFKFHVIKTLKLQGYNCYHKIEGKTYESLLVTDDFLNTAYLIFFDRVYRNFEKRTDEVAAFLEYLKLSVRGIVKDMLQKHRKGPQYYYCIGSNRYNVGSCNSDTRKSYLMEEIRDKNKKEIRKAINEAKHNLTKKQKFVFEEWYYNGKSAKELSLVLDCTSRNIYSLKDKALTNLQKNIDSSIWRDHCYIYNNLNRGSGYILEKN